MDRIASYHALQNERTRQSWDQYAEHRRLVTELLTNARGPGRERLCVLGAGNANDLDLAALAAAFREVHLVDIDAAALAAATARLPAETSGSIKCHAGVDLTGILPQLDSWAAETPPDEGAVDSALQAAVEFAGPALPGPFDVVVSTCVLTQLIESVVKSLDPAHPRFRDLLLAVRDRHLRLLVELTAPGGVAMLVTDIVSSDTCPEVARVPPVELPAVVDRLISERNFFTGVNPYLLKRWYEQDAEIGLQFDGGVRLIGPWRWSVGPRAFAVFALKMVRRPAASAGAGHSRG